MVDEQEDDWAPLTSEQLTQRPWEAEDAAVTRGEGRVGAAAKPVPVAPMPERGPEKTLSPRQEEVVRELQARCAKAGPGNSLITQLQHREMRAKRKYRAARKVADQLTATCVVGALPSEPEPVLEISKKSDVDPRELEGWFQELPEAEQARLHQMWSGERHRFDDSGRIYRTRLKRASCYGAIAFFGMAVLLAGMVGGFYMVPGLAFAGAVAGAIAHVLGGSRFVYAGCGLIAYLCANGLSLTGNPYLLYGAVLAAALMGVVGMDGEMRRSAGFSKD